MTRRAQKGRWVADQDPKSPNTWQVVYLPEVLGVGRFVAQQGLSSYTKCLEAIALLEQAQGTLKSPRDPHGLAA